MPSAAATAAALPQVWLLSAAFAASQPPPQLVPPVAPPLAPLRELAQLKAEVARLDQRASQLERFGALRALGTRGGLLINDAVAPLLAGAVAAKPQPAQVAGAALIHAASPEHHGPSESPLSAPASMALLVGRLLAVWACGDAAAAVEGNSGGAACGNTTSTAQRGSDGGARTSTIVSYAALNLCGLLCFCWFAWRTWSPIPNETDFDRDYRRGMCLLVLGMVALADLGIVQPMVETLAVYAWLAGVAFFFASGYLRAKFGHTARAIQAEVKAIGQGVRAIHSVMALTESGLGKVYQGADDVLDALGLSDDSDEAEAGKAAPGAAQPAARPKSRWNDWRCGC